MKMKSVSLLFLLLFTFFSTQAQDYSLLGFDIPKDLKENANAVVRDHFWDITIESVDKIVIKRRYVVTLLNKIGHERFSDTYAHYDDDTKIKKLSAKIYNAFGKEIKKFSKGKFTDISAVDGGSLYSSSRVKYVEYTPISYPYTLVFEVETVSKTTGFIPRWKPLPSYYLGVQKNTYKLTNKTTSKIRTKEKFFGDYTIERKDLEKGFQYTISNVEPVKYEENSVGLKNLTPELMVASNTFALKGVRGEAKDWNEFGEWMYRKLIMGRSVLEEATKSKIKSLVQGVDDPIEKAKIVYKFMQDKTRYISVQVGIGGWEPIAANQVDKVGYGDCKGLTNYTKALLDVVGVESYYTVVYASDREDIDKDFASIQGTHVILNIPNEGKDIWLECTSQIMPFGFLGDFTDDRNVLVITPEGGIIKRTSSYLNEENLQTSRAVIKLDAKGNVSAKIDRVSKGIQYDRKFYLESESESELKKHYKSNIWAYNNNLEIKNIKIKNDKDSVVFNEKMDITIAEYASINQNDYLFRVNIFNRNSFVPKRYRKRKLPLKVSRGYKDVDNYTFTIPEGHQITMLPSDKVINNKFGEYKVSFKKIDDATFTYQKILIIKAGEYPKEDYDSYRKFRKSISKYDNIRISLTKIPKN
jgi:hypothetical protein